MSAANANARREDLLRQIVNSLRQWPEPERRIFAQTHYYGKSPETISRSLELDLEQVNLTLRRCDRRLHSSLRKFREVNRDGSSHRQSEPAGAAVCDREVKKVPVVAPEANRTIGCCRMAV